jgi:hypothetical protein
MGKSGNINVHWLVLVDPSVLDQLDEYKRDKWEAMDERPALPAGYYVRILSLMQKGDDGPCRRLQILQSSTAIFSEHKMLMK